MSYSFSANQYNDAYLPRRLGNWEVPQRYPSRPRNRSGATRPIVNDRGHLLPGVRRPENVSPWGLGPYTAWDHPNKITRAFANEMEAEASRRLAAWLKRSAHVPLPQQEVPPSPLPEEIEPQEKNAQNLSPIARKSPSPEQTSCLKQVEARTERRNSAVSSRSSQKENVVMENPKVRETRRSSAASSARIPPSPPQVPESLSEIRAPRSLQASSRRSSASVRPQTAPAPPAPSVSSEVSQSGPPLGMGYSAFQVARALAEDSRSHQPLPDKVHDPLFCALQARRHRDPGLVLPSPDAKSQVPATPPRPASSGPPPRRITEMDLAIRWDLRLPNEKRSNLTGPPVAPAVFNVVSSSGDCRLPGACNTPPPLLPRKAWSENTADVIKPLRSPDQNMVQNNTANVSQHKSSPPRRSRSTPNLSRRACAACDDKKKPPATAPPAQQTQLKNNSFKQAFKAGRPNNSRPTTALPKPLIVPQPRKPFTKRSYSIATLAPPFSLWPDGSRAQDYPDHWRLASVYQHAYKHPQLRRKPLLASVFQ